MRDKIADLIEWAAERLATWIRPRPKKVPSGVFVSEHKPNTPVTIMSPEDFERTFLKGVPGIDGETKKN